MTNGAGMPVAATAPAATNKLRNNGRITVLPRFQPWPSLTVVHWVVQEGGVLFIVAASLAIFSSGAGFYSGPIGSSMLVAGDLGRLAAGGTRDFAAHPHLQLLALGLLARDDNLGARAGYARF